MNATRSTMTAVAHRTKRDRKWDVSTGVCGCEKVRYNLREGQYYERMANNNNQREFLREGGGGKCVCVCVCAISQIT